MIDIIFSIGAAAQVTGGNILGVYGQALQVLDDFLASAQGQAALISIFDALNQVGVALGDVLAGIAPAIPPLFRGSGSILSVLSPLLGTLSEPVGSVLTSLAPLLSIAA